MSGGTVADLLADLLLSQPTPAKTANPAKARASIDFPADNGTCEGLREVANLPTEVAAPAPDSQKFADLRNPTNAPQSGHWHGSSQLSQISQGLPGTSESPRLYKLTKAEGDRSRAEPWDDAAIARFVARVGLMMRRGFDATDADDLAERLHLRDVQGDDRACCVECRHYRPGRCGNPMAAGLLSPDVGRNLAVML